MFDPWQGFCHLTQPNDQTMPPLNSVSASHLCLPCQFYLWSHFSSSCSPCGRLQMAATQGRSTQVVQLLLNPHFPWSWSSLSWLGNCFFDQCSWTLNRWDKGQRENINILSLYVFYQLETIYIEHWDTLFLWPHFHRRSWLVWEKLQLGKSRKILSRY